MPPAEDPKGLDAVRLQYSGQWIAAIVTTRASNGQPLKVSVVASHVDRYRLRDYIPHEAEVCIFFGGGLTKDGYELAI